LKPKVIVVTPVLNGEQTIKDCLESVKMQDYPFVEHLCVDGNSSDGTLDIITKSGVKYISGQDAGIYDAFSKGVIAADGDIIHILNADDFYASKNIVSSAVDFMQKHELDLCHGYIEQIDVKGKSIRRVGCIQDKKALLSKMRVAHPSVFVKKSVYNKYGVFSVGFKVAGDHEFLLRVWDKVAVGFLPIVFVKMRLGGASNSQVDLSYRESMAAAILHGRSPLRGVIRFYWETIKNRWLMRQ